MRHEANYCGSATSERRKALVVCTHLRPGRTKRRSRHYLQPITGLHIASLIDQRHFDVRLYHEDWHGPYDTQNTETYDLVFLTGLQADFDRMRQLSYYFRRSGAVVVAGGSICSLFPEFATRFFDAVCAGGVDSVADVVTDFLGGGVAPIYRSPQSRITNYHIDYSLLARNGINPSLHLIEASRGCNFRCSFCVIPAEGAHHTSYQLSAVRAAVDDAITSSPLFSFRRWYPMLFFLDNNFSSDRKRMLEISDLLRANRKVRAWGAMVTQDVLHDRELLKHLAVAKCRALFTGLESLDQNWLRSVNKKQNLSRRGNILDDILFAEAQGICIMYGYLFDPRSHTVDEMKSQIALFEKAAPLPLPTFFSLILPLVGTASFWTDFRRGELLSNLRLRDLDGETIAYSRLADSVSAVRGFVEAFSRHPSSLVSRRRVLLGTLKRIWNSNGFNPVQWYLIWATNFHTFVWARSYPSSRQTYLAGEDILDPQYSEHPRGISAEDWQLYFEPIQLTDDAGRLSDWLQPYVPNRVKYDSPSFVRSGPLA
jgi:hopanoid C-2 methylase